MSTRIDYTPLGGGFDLVSGALGVAPGRLSECMNFEQVFGKQGYRRIEGYERYDGRPEPHKASYWVVRFKDGTAAVAPGSIISGATASALVVATELESGAWDGSAKGRLIVTSLAGAFAVNETLKVGALSVATLEAAVERGSLSESLNNTYIFAAREALRGAIQAVPGSGPVLGVAVYRNAIYAARNAADGETAALYKSTSTGWQVVRSGLLPGGSFRFDVANFSGSSTSISLFGVDGKNRPFRWDGANFTLMAPIYGTQATSSSSVTIGTGNKTFTIIEPTRSWAVGQELIAHDIGNAGNRMIGTVVSYASNVLTLNVVSTKGAGTSDTWEIGRADFRDKPHLVLDHKDHLFLAYPLGQLQTSNLGDPMTYTSTAALFGIGDEITGIVSMRGAVLGVFCLNRIVLLSGSTSLDWSMESYSSSAGAKAFTVQEMAGNALFLDDRGLTSLQSTQNFGDFEPSIFSRDVKPMLDAYTTKIVGSRIAKTKFQYRLYASDGTRMTATILSPEAVIRPQDVAFTRQQYPDAAVCVAQGDMEDGTEGLFFGTANGYVMREDVGTSFDGAEIGSVMRLHFNNLKSPANKKRFRKLDIELDSPGAATILFRQQFDYGDGNYSPSLTNEAVTTGGGGQWGVSGWDEFRWSLPVFTKAEANIDGVGRNMGLIVWHSSASDQPFILQGLLLQYTVLGLAR